MGVLGPFALARKGDQDDPPVVRAFGLFRQALGHQLVHRRRHRGQANVQKLGNFADGGGAVPACLGHSLQHVHLANGQVHAQGVVQHHLFQLLDGTVNLYQKLVQVVLKRRHKAPPFLHMIS